MTAEQLETCTIRLAERLGLFRDYATVLLVGNNWDEDFIVSQWNLPDNGFAMSIKKDCNFLTRETRCDGCSRLKTCKTYGCDHLLCQQCVKGYLEGKISSGDINMKCPLENCQMMMCPSVFLNDVSREFRKRFSRNLLTSYKSSQPCGSLISCGYETILSNKWIMLYALLLAALLYRGTCKCAFEFNFQM